MKDKKAAKKLLKLAKEHPEWYSEEDVRYAKQVKWRIKQEKLQQKMNAVSYTHLTLPTICSV